MQSAIPKQSQIDNRPLLDLIPDSVVFIPRTQAMETLKISEALLRRDQEVLLFLKPLGFDYQSKDIGFSWESLNVLWEFRKLVRQQGRKRAINQINNHMEQYYERSR